MWETLELGEQSMENLEILKYAAWAFGFAGTLLLSYQGILIFADAAEKRRAAMSDEGGVPTDSFMAVFTPEQLFFITLLGAFLGGAIIYLLTDDYLFAFAGAIFGVLVPQLVQTVMRNRLIARFEAQLIDALQTMSNSLKAGYNLIQAFELVAKEMTPPISVEFSTLTKENKLGVHMDKALSNLGKRVQSTNLDLVINSISIVRQSGGNLAEVFDRIAETIRERSRLEGKVNAMTAQGKLQGLILCLLPIFLIVGINILDPTIMEVLFTDPMGMVIITLVIMLYLIAGFMIYKIVNVKI